MKGVYQNPHITWTPTCMCSTQFSCCWTWPPTNHDKNKLFHASIIVKTCLILLSSIHHTMRDRSDRSCLCLRTDKLCRQSDFSAVKVFQTNYRLEHPGNYLLYSLKTLGVKYPKKKSFDFEIASLLLKWGKTVRVTRRSVCTESLCSV